MVEEIRVSIIIRVSIVNMYILCDLKGQCLNHDHVAHVYEYITVLASTTVDLYFLHYFHLDSSEVVQLVQFKFKIF